MKTIKNTLFTFIALCACLFVFFGCESTKVDSQVETPITTEPTVNDNVEDVVVNETDLKLTVPSAEALSGSWVLYTMSDKDGDYPISCEVTIAFAFNDELEVYGCAGINNYHGIANIDGTSISFENDIAVTKMAGLPEDMLTEDNYLRILSAVDEIGFAQNEEGYSELILANPKTGAILCFVR